MKAEVDVLGSPVPNNPYGLCGRKAAFVQEEGETTELRNCVKVVVDVLDPLGPNSLYGLWT